MYRFFLSLRYLRARKTNWIGMAGITLAVGALIMILSIMSGFLAESRRHLRGNLSDLLIKPRFGTSFDLRDDVQGLLEIVRADERVEAASAQLVWYGMLAPEGRQDAMSDAEFGKLALVGLVGIDVEDEFASTSLREDLLRESRILVPQHVADVNDPFAPPPGYEPDGRPEASVIVGEQLAYAWNLFQGQEIEIVTATLDQKTGTLGDPINQRFVIAGTFRSTENELDGQRLYFDRRVLADWLGSGGPGDESAGFSQVLVKLKDYERNKGAAAADLYAKLHRAGYLHPPGTFSRMHSEIRTWEDFRRNMLAAISNEKVLLGIMLSLVMVVAGFTVFAILSMMVSEKRRDIGIVCALGGTRGGVLATFLLIGFWEAVIGATVGTVAGVLLAVYVDPIERWLSRLFGVEIFNRQVYLFDHIPAVIHVTGVALIVLGAFLCTLVFASLPALRAARLEPVDALRYE